MLSCNHQSFQIFPICISFLPKPFQIKCKFLLKFKEIFNNTKQLYNCTRRLCRLNWTKATIWEGTSHEIYIQFYLCNGIWCVIMFIRLNSWSEKRQKDMVSFGEFLSGMCFCAWYSTWSHEQFFIHIKIWVFSFPDHIF